MNLRQEARNAATRHGIDPDIFERQIDAESQFNVSARSPKGALGIAQFMPDTAKGLGIDPLNPREALDAAAQMMAHGIKAYGSYENALRAYNAGPAAIAKSHGYAETNAYVNKILNGKSGALHAAQRAGGQDLSVRTKTVPGTEATVSPAREVADPQAAVLAALASPQPLARKLPKLGSSSGLAARAQSNILSGQYTKTVPTQVTLGKDAQAQVTTTTAPAGAVARATGKGGTVTIDGKKVAAWIAPALQYAKAHGWSGVVQSGYRSFADQTRIYNSGVRPAAKPGTSNHEATQFPRGAVDVSNAEQLSAILKKSPYASKLVWAGGKDPVHFSHPHNGSY